MDSNSKKSQFESEAELARIVIKYLESNNWEVFKEVKPKNLNTIADIVAIKDKKIWIIETKLIYGTKVLEQAYKWTKYAHYVSVAVPLNKQYSFVLEHFRKSFGIGKLFVHHNESIKEKGFISEKEPPQFNNTLLETEIWSSLHSRQKDSIAGAKGGGYITPYKLTIEKVKKFLEYNPKSNVYKIVNAIDHHYSNNSVAMNNLHKMLSEVEPDFDYEIINGEKLFFLKK
jgi:hypothetical protein